MLRRTALTLHTKRGGWGWHHSKMERASSVERLWLAMALAQLWCVSLGCQAEAEFEAACLHHEPGASLPERHIARQRRTSGGSTSCSSLELCGARKTGPACVAVSVQTVPCGHLAGRNLAPDHHRASETAQAFSGEEEENAQGKGTSKKTKTPSAGTCPRKGVKNLYL